MNITIVAAGNKMPRWVTACCDEYFQRLPGDFKVDLIEVPIEKRRKSQSIDALKKKETQRLLQAVPDNTHIIALDEKGKVQTTTQVANALNFFHAESRSLSILIGGPDGLDFSVEHQSRKSWPDARWSLSLMTFPHPLVRVILAEQIYRAWSIIVGHPYHRE